MSQVTLSDCFDHIYCLTLNRRPERWKRVKQEFKKLNIEVERFPAIDGNSLSKRKIEKYSIINKYAIGCMLSHYKIIEDAKKHKYKNILIFEDDVIFHKNFAEEFSKQIKKVKNWKILYLGATQTHWNNIEYGDGFYYSLDTLGTFAIGINESIYEEIVALTKFNAAIDTKYINLQHKHYKKCYTFYPNLVIADVSTSDIRGHRDEKLFREMARWDESLYDIEKTSFIKFSIPEQIVPATIDVDRKTVFVYVSSGTDVSNLTPTYTLSKGSTCIPESGTPNDFTYPAVMSITSKSGKVDYWTVVVTVTEYHK